MASGRSSRAKGVAGERESADVFRRYGFEVVRLQNNVEDAGDFSAVAPYPQTISGPSGTGILVPVRLLVDTKRRERFEHVTASRQIEAIARDGQLPCVVWRPNREPWRITTLLDPFLAILAGEA